MVKRLYNKAFTLVELILVIAILGVLSVIALPKFYSYRHDAELSVANAIGGALQEAQDLYFNRLIIETEDYSRRVNSFWTFVNFQGGANGRNMLRIDSTLRNRLVDPSANLYQDDGSILLNFKSGFTATYRIDANGGVSKEFTEP
ncbi:MAG: type II secretion system protein [Pseudomonadota bacterium]